MFKSKWCSSAPHFLAMIGLLLSWDCCLEILCESGHGTGKEIETRVFSCIIIHDEPWEILAYVENNKREKKKKDSYVLGKKAVKSIFNTEKLFVHPLFLVAVLFLHVKQILCYTLEVLKFLFNPSYLSKIITDFNGSSAWLKRTEQDSEAVAFCYYLCYSVPLPLIVKGLRQ